MRVNYLRRLYWFVRGFILVLSGMFIRKRPQPNINQIKKVLVIALFRIGDAVYATPVIRELKKNLPDVSIDLVCKNYTTAVYENNPHLRNNYIFQDGIVGFWRIRSILLKNNYDLVIDLTADDKLIGALLARFSGISYCLGYTIQKRGFCLDQPVSFPKEKLHATEIYLHLLDVLKISTHSNIPEIFVTDNEKDKIKVVLKKHDISIQDFIVGLHPGANFPSQRLSEKKWASFCDVVQEKYKKKIVLFGGPKDRKLIEVISKLVTSPVIVIDKLAGLRSTIAFIDRCNILLCNNSGPLHIAEALGTPTLSWMGPTIPYRWQPIGPNHQVIRKEVDCAPCNRGVCESHQCETLVTVENLEEAFGNLLKKILEKRNT